MFMSRRAPSAAIEGWRVAAHANAEANARLLSATTAS
jgi:hypothetical protein